MHSLKCLKLRYQLSSMGYLLNTCLVSPKFTSKSDDAIFYTLLMQDRPKVSKNNYYHFTPQS